MNNKPNFFSPYETGGRLQTHKLNNITGHESNDFLKNYFNKDGRAFPGRSKPQRHDKFGEILDEEIQENIRNQLYSGNKREFIIDSVYNKILSDFIIKPKNEILKKLTKITGPPATVTVNPPITIPSATVQPPQQAIDEEIKKGKFTSFKISFNELLIKNLYETIFRENETKTYSRPVSGNNYNRSKFIKDFYDKLGILKIYQNLKLEISKLPHKSYILYERMTKEGLPQITDEQYEQIIDILLNEDFNYIINIETQNKLLEKNIIDREHLEQLKNNFESLKKQVEEIQEEEEVQEQKGQEQEGQEQKGPEVVVSQSGEVVEEPFGFEAQEQLRIVEPGERVRPQREQPDGGGGSSGTLRGSRRYRHHRSKGRRKN